MVAAVDWFGRNALPTLRWRAQLSGPTSVLQNAAAAGISVLTGSGMPVVPTWMAVPTPWRFPRTLRTSPR
jgi:hypothetical protein